MKTVLITGASRGIGAQTARRFAAEGYSVAVHYNASETAALALVEELRQAGAQAHAFRADVTRSEQVETMISAVPERLGGLDVLVCNAGIAWQGLLTDMTDETWRRIFAVNVDGVFHCCRAAIPHFVRRKAGRIITVSSMWGVTGASCEAAYSAAKAAVIGLTRALAKELGPSGITVNCVAPGVIATDMLAGLDGAALETLREETPLGRLGTPADVAGCIAFLASGEAAFLTGQVLGPNGGLVI